MQQIMLELLRIFGPGIIAVCGTFITNYFFYIFIKDKIDKSVERYKVAYSGVFKEKVEIYKILLKQNYDLKSKIVQFQHLGSDALSDSIKIDINELNQYYLINQMFLSVSIIKNVQLIIKELQSCFEDFYMHNRLEYKDGIPPETRTELLNKFFQAGNKFKTNNPFQALEDNIIAEMRQDLQTDNFN